VLKMQELEYRTHYYLIDEPLQDMIQAGRYNPALLLIYEGQAIEIKAGKTDEIAVFWVADGLLLVIAANYRLPYIGMEVFQDGERIGEVFLQEHQTETIEERLGRDLDKIEEHELAGTLIDYVY
jgi:hypothetical protein